MSENTDSTIHHDKLESILANAVDAIITINDLGIVESVNPATQTMFGYDASEVIGNNVNMLMPSPYREQHDSYLQNYLQTGIKKIIGIGREVMGLRKDGSTFPMHLAVSEIQADGKKLFTGIVRDISDVKEVEKKLLQNERLAAIGQMMAGLAHESRNAFQKSHACLTNLAFDVREMPESLELVQKVQDSLDHLNAMLDEVRDYAAPIVLEKALCNVESVIREMWSQLIQANPHSDKIQLQIDRTSDFPDQIKIDRFRIGQVIWNLLENARVAVGDDQGAILVKLDYDDSKRMCAIRLIDNGNGIDSDKLDSIFQPFFTTKTKGTGLGLAICQRITEAHGGFLTAENRDDENGACFVLNLPA